MCLDEYNNHILKKNEAKVAKDIAKNSCSPTTAVITMDLQSVLLSPNIKASAVYYKQKLKVHDFTFYQLNDRKVDLYVWHEGEGSVSANELVSCIISHLHSLSNDIDKVILISDGCGYQNRNKTLSSALSDFAKARSVTVEQLILERGHTMMEADSVHFTLEQVQD